MMHASFTGLKKLVIILGRVGFVLFLITFLYIEDKSSPHDVKILSISFTCKFEKICQVI